MFETKFLQQEPVVASPAHESVAAVQKAEDIARAELARRRRRLGNLTPDQEMKIEALLISTVNKISRLIAAKQSELKRSTINHSLRTF
jgi:glutamyl-tRNA reductase